MSNINRDNKWKVSCIIPTYKRCDTLCRAIDSVINQTYKDIEVLVVDDNEPNDEYSTRVKDVVKQYKNNKNVKYIQQEKHINGAVARNVGIKNAKGNYIAFLDDDDEWLPTKIEKQIKYFNDSNIDIVSCFWTTYKNGKIIRKCYPYNSKNIKFKILSREISIFTSTVIMRKDIIKEFDGFNETLLRHQDLQFLVDACEFGNFNVDNEYLVNLYADSEINKPNTNKLINAKKKFLKLEKNKIDKFNIIDRLRIYGAHNYEVLFSAIKEKKILISMLYFLKVFLNIFAFVDVIKRYFRRNNK